MEWLRGSVTEGGVATFGETELKTPVGRANNLAMAIHEVEFEITPLDAKAAGDSIELQLTMNSKAAIAHISNSDLIAKWSQFIQVTTEGSFIHTAEKVQKFYPPLLYAKSSIYFGTITVGQAGASTSYVRIGYTLRFVSATRMVQALVD